MIKDCIHPRLKDPLIVKKGNVRFTQAECYYCPKTDVIITCAYREVVDGIYELKPEYLEKGISHIVNSDYNPGLESWVKEQNPELYDRFMGKL